MDTRIDFLTRSIEEAHRTIRFTDMKAAGLVIFESLLLVVAIAGFAGNPMRGLVRNLIEEGVIWYAALILATFILYAMALVVHILLTIRVLLPVDKPELHVNLGDFDPVGLFYLGRLDEERRITPSVSAYGETLGEMLHSPDQGRPPGPFRLAAGRADHRRYDVRLPPGHRRLPLLNCLGGPPPSNKPLRGFPIFSDAELQV
jgi:hypothetical protein